MRPLALVVAVMSSAACRSGAPAAVEPTRLGVVENGLRGDLTLLELGPSEAKRTVLGCAQVGHWAERAAVRDGVLAVLDTERRQLLTLDLAALKSARCRDGVDLISRRIPLHGGALPYRARLLGDWLYVTFFSENRVEVYRWPSLDWERDLAFAGPENIGVSDVDLAADGHTLLITATGYRCFARHCPEGRFKHPRLIFVDSQGTMEPPYREVATANVNTLFALGRPGVVVNAGELEGGYGSLQRIRDDGTLGPELELPRAAGPSWAVPLKDGRLLLNQEAGEHLFIVDPQLERLEAIWRFDGRAFVSVAADIGALPERWAAELVDMVPDPIERDVVWLLDRKGDRLIRVRARGARLEVERVETLATESFHSATDWMVWLP